MVLLGPLRQASIREAEQDARQEVKGVKHQIKPGVPPPWPSGPMMGDPCFREP